MVDLTIPPVFLRTNLITIRTNVRTSCACSSTCTSILPWRVNGTIDIVSRSYIKTFNAASTYSIDLCGTSSGGLTQNVTTRVIVTVA